MTEHYNIAQNVSLVTDIIYGYVIICKVHKCII